MKQLWTKWYFNILIFFFFVVFLYFSPNVILLCLRRTVKREKKIDIPSEI